MLSIASSRFALHWQIAFLSINTCALVLGLIYNHKTPELYANNAHSKTGWAVTWIAVAWVIMALSRVYAGDATAQHEVIDSRQPMTTANMTQYQRVQDMELPAPSRWSDDSGQGTERDSALSFDQSRSPSVNRDHQQRAAPSYTNSYDELPACITDTGKHVLLSKSTMNRLLSRCVACISTGRALVVIRGVYTMLERTMLVQGLAAILSGTVVYGGIGVSVLR